MTTNHPITNICQKNSRKTHAAYNCGEEALNVAFSDGGNLIAKIAPLTHALPKR